MRERYEDWLDDRLGVLRHGRERDRDMPAAEAKRVRKAAKRRRDAELTRLGRVASDAWVEAGVWWATDTERNSAAILRRELAHDDMRAIRRGEVQP